MIDTSIEILRHINSDQLEGRQPLTIAGSCLFLSSIIHSATISKEDIAEALRISKKSIYKISNIIRDNLLKKKIKLNPQFLNYLE